MQALANSAVSADAAPRAIRRRIQTMRGERSETARGSRAIRASGWDGISAAGREGSSTAPQ